MTQHHSILSTKTAFCRETQLCSDTKKTKLQFGACRVGLDDAHKHKTNKRLAMIIMMAMAILFKDNENDPVVWLNGQQTGGQMDMICSIG